MAKPLHMHLKQLKIIIRCDASAEIGYGHVIRCLALARQLQDNNKCLVFFAMRGDETGIQFVRNNGYTVITPEQNQKFNYSNWIQAALAKSQAEILILDVRDDLPPRVLLEIKTHNVTVVTIDDPSERRLFADMAFYPPVPQVRQMDWKNFTGDLYCGWEWVILREEFATAPKKIIIKERPVVLVTMGGSDPYGLTIKAIKSLNMIEENFDTIVILGKGFQYKDELNVVMSTATRHFELRWDVKNMAETMTCADLAVASFGVTAYELAAVNVPAIYLCLTEDHSRSATIFVDKGIAINMGVYNHVTEFALSTTIARYLRNKQLRKEMMDGLRQLPKQNGAYNIGTLILKKAGKY